MSEEKSVLRWGGLAGILGGILPILFFVTIYAFVPSGFVTVAPIGSFPEVRTATTVAESVYLAAVSLWVVLLLSLYRALRGGSGRSAAPALYGCGVGLVGLVLLAAGGISAVAFGHISDLYHAPNASVQDQSTLGLVWQGVQAIFNETDAVGGILFATGFVLFGIAILWNPAFGKTIGVVCLTFGLAGLVGVSVSAAGYAYALVVIILPLLLGWKLYSMSRTL
jgi:hypothetical protein